MRDIPGYEGLYAVTEDGRVWSNNAKRFLKHSLTKLGYAKYTLGNKILYTHRIVATAYLPNNMLKKCVNHRDGNKLNNHVDNLEWCTHSENSIHSFHFLGNKNALLQYKKAKLACMKKIGRYTKLGDFIDCFESVSEASRRLRINQGQISNCARGNTKSCGGFIWKYL